MTHIINAKHAPKGWRDDPRYVDVRRTRGGRVEWSVKAQAKGYFGNPFPVTEGMPLSMALGLFREYAEHRVKHDPMFGTMVEALNGMTLVCACAPNEGLTKDDPHVCHGQILAEIAERLAGGSE